MTRRYRRPRRRFGRRLVDRLLVATCWAGLAWLAIAHLTPYTGAAKWGAVLVGGMVLGRSARLPRFRSPIAWSGPHRRRS